MPTNVRDLVSEKVGRTLEETEEDEKKEGKIRLLLSLQRMLPVRKISERVCVCV